MQFNYQPQAGTTARRQCRDIIGHDAKRSAGLVSVAHPRQSHLLSSTPVSAFFELAGSTGGMLGEMCPSGWTSDVDRPSGRAAAASNNNKPTSSHFSFRDFTNAVFV